MIGSVSANRRANAFAQLVAESRPGEPRPGDEAAVADPPVAGPRAPADGAEQAVLLSVVERLADLPRPELGAETRASQRALLIATMEAAAAAAPDGLTEAPPCGDRVPEQRGVRGGQGTHRALPLGGLARLRPRSRLTKGLAAGSLTMGVAAGALGGVAAASTDALPGDTLYGLKRGMEDLRLDFTSGDVDRGRVYLDHASTRLNEARRLMERTRAGVLDPEELEDIRKALSSMRDDAAEGHRLLSQAHAADGSIDPIESLSAFAERHREAWAQLRYELPFALRDVGDEVTDVFDAIDEDVAPFESLFPHEPGSLSSADDFGGRPAQTPAQAEPTTSAAPPGSGTDAGGGADESGGSAASPGDSEPGAGLLDGTGLLGPVGGEDGATGGSPAEPGGAVDALPEAEITIPPLLEDLLPELGLDVTGGGA
ncbi:DUF5667 domain-containing protein [Streptomyces sp. NBC_01803]|uniref:DUF5667 domain-containing protein n=1 Tax=Streptomyces sp. NBC_01803 TaxID=2975946 RepID=UPI002DDA0FE8|nr:DUF5667 domain-containing protein [Streptomyces sp. NBC_01803]WSA44924.1 DUF5667 domain-containing protein [Streptomyces sp. NBC_01803]